MNNLNQPTTPKTSFKRGWLFIIIAIIGLCALSLASSSFINKKINEINQESATQNQLAIDNQIYTPAKQLLIEGQSNTWNIFGATKPKITIVEFGDFTCHYSQENFIILRSLMIKHQDIIKFIYRDRLSTERSVVLAMAAHCAGEQEKFWPMHDKLFQYQSDTLGNNPDDLNNLAQSINLNLINFKSCLNNQKYLEEIKQNMLASIDLGVNGTPTFFINGQKYEGTLSNQEFEQIINEYR